MADDMETTEDGLISPDDFIAEMLMAGLGSEQLPPSIERIVFDPDTGKRELSDTPGLVNDQGIIQIIEKEMPDGTVQTVPFYYDLDRDPQSAYNSLSPERRQFILDVMGDRGVPVQTWEQQQRAFQKLYGEANRFGKTADVMLADIIEKVPPTKTQSRVAPYRVTSSQDLKTVLNQVSRQTIGRELSDSEAARFAASYQQQQRDYQQRASTQSGGTVEQSPSADVAAQQFVEQYEPSEANAYKFLGYFDQMANSLGSRI